MSLLRKIATTILLFFGCYSSCFSMENVFYVLHSNFRDRMTPFATTLSSLTNHYQTINILIPQAYQIDGNGQVSGFIDPEILDFAHRHSMKIMPLITNIDFNKKM